MSKRIRLGTAVVDLPFFIGGDCLVNATHRRHIGQSPGPASFIYAICAVQLAYRAGARVIATCRSKSDMAIASRAGADDVLLADEKLVARVQEIASDGVDHIVEVAFAANIKMDIELLSQGGSIAVYAANAPTPEIPFWQLVFMNSRIFFIGSDDIPTEAKIEATKAINHAFEAGWQGFEIAERFQLDEIADAHEFVEHPPKSGRVIVMI